MDHPKRVLSIGQCGADHGAIARTFEEQFGALVDPAHDADEALARLQEGPYDLVLINRVLDADGTMGVDLIRRIRSSPKFQAVPVMLVSNYDDAQDEAVAQGAVRGFGKASLGLPAMTDRVRPYLE